jgi:predicted phosphodiesterase|tara:strand:- start:7900 stop:8673 length:774 start_codon:yes stop_codon:yes gene_type:complete
MKKPYKRALVIPDIHFPLQNQPAVNCVLEAIKLVKPNIFICIGDIGEWKSVSPFKYKRRRRPPLEYVIKDLELDAKAVNDGLDQFDKVLKEVNCDEKHMIEGNHDNWLNYFVEEYPYLKDYAFKSVVKLDERGYKYHPYGKFLKIGKLYFYHGGHYTTMYHAKQHAEKLGKNVVYGHTHDVQRFGVTHVDGAHHGFTIGCLKDMSRESNLWLKGRTHNWCHAFAIIDWFKSGAFRFDLVDITSGRTFVWGKEINGNQ